MYDYDKANRLTSEYRTHNGRAVNNSSTYYYNPDGSISQEKIGSDTYRKYNYNKGRLTDLIQYYDLFSSAYNRTYFKHDNLGNCTHYNLSNENAPANMFWERGNLLKKYTIASGNTDKTVEYFYNNQGIRYKKKVGNKETIYYLDGAKIICEKGNKWILYIYDIEGIYGFKYLEDYLSYRYVKDAMGNVISITNGDREVAHYEYDAWGNCTVRDEDGNITTDQDHIGNINPIRWKSQYYDTESGLYYINGRYYSPLIRQYVSMGNVEVASANAGTLYGLNSYLLTVANPVNMIYNNYTIETSMPLSYDSEELSNWKVFWHGAFRGYNNLHWGWKIGIGTAVIIGLAIATVATGGAAGFALAGMTKGAIIGAVTAAVLANTVQCRTFKQSRKFLRTWFYYSGISVGVKVGESILTCSQINGWALLATAGFGFIGGAPGAGSWGKGWRNIFVGFGLGGSEDALGWLFGW